MTVRVRVLSVAAEEAARARAASGVAKSVGVTFGEARALVDGPRVLPGVFGADEAAALVEALVAVGFAAEAGVGAGGGWATGVRRARLERTRWRRPLEVSVALLGERAAPPAVTAAWQAQLPT